MSEMTLPPSVSADGNLKVTWVPALADPQNPTEAELNAATAVDLSCYLTPDGYNPSVDEQEATDPRLCSRQEFARAGRVKHGLTLRYVYQGQGGDAAGNKAYTTLKHLTEGFLVTRWGTDYEVDHAAGDVLDVGKAECGVQRKLPPEANSVLKIEQSIRYIGTLHEDVVVAGP